MTNQDDEAKSIDQLRKERSEYFPPPRSVGDAVVAAFILENLSSFKKYVCDRPKPFQVAAHRWVRDSLEEVRKSRLHTECANDLGLPDCFSELPEVFKWYEVQKQETELTSRNIAPTSKNIR